MNRRRVLAALGASGILGVGALGLGTKGPIGYTQAATIGDCGNFDLNVEWRETYDGGEGTVLIDDSRDNEEFEGRPSINLADVKPGDSGTFCFQIELSTDDSNFSGVEPKLSFDTPANWKAENGINEPEETAGDMSTGDNAGELQNFIYVTLWEDNGLVDSEAMGAANCEFDSMMETLIFEGWLSDVVDDVDKYLLGELGDGDTLSVGFAWEFREMGKNNKPANIAQTDSVTFAFDIYAECRQ